MPSTLGNIFCLEREDRERERERDWDVCFIVMEAWKGREKRTLQEEKGSGFFQTLLWF